MMAWAEDRAPWRHDPSADPGAKTEGGAARCRPVFPLRDWHQGGKSTPSDPMCTLPYLPTPVSPFHAEPLHSHGSEGGGVLSRLSLPYHWLYYLYSSLAFAVIVVEHVIKPRGVVPLVFEGRRLPEAEWSE